MRTRAVPGTGLLLSEIGFGCGGNAGLMVRGTEAEQARAVARALDLGITYFDTAPDYGDGAAELALGRALRAAGRAAVVTTKVEVRRDDLADVAGHVVASAEASLRRLGVAGIDVLQVHNGPVAAGAAMSDGYHTLPIGYFLGPRGAAEGLRRLLDRGLIGHAGFVCRGGDGVEIRQLMDTGLFRLVNVAYSLLHRDGADALEAAGERGVGAAVFSPLAGGVLAGSAAQHALARPRDAEAGRRRGAPFEGLAREWGGSMAQAAYRFVLAHPGVTTVLGGFSSVEQMEEIAAVAAMPALTDRELAGATGDPRVKPGADRS